MTSNNLFDSIVHSIMYGDNCIYLLIDDNRHCIAIDPGCADAVLKVTQKENLQLTRILLTHHHADHTSGAALLKSKTHCQVIGPDSQRIPELDEVVSDNQILNLGKFSLHTLATPGHTRTSVCYVLELPAGQPISIFTGDTLFVCGCGRLFENSAEEMYHSLQKLTILPDDTTVYPGHDYSLENYRFALTVEPDNAVVREQMSKLKNKGPLSIIPSTIGLEKQTNPFLRTQSPAIRQTLGMFNALDVEILAELRMRKNLF